MGSANVEMAVSRPTDFSLFSSPPMQFVHSGGIEGDSDLLSRLPQMLQALL